MVKEINENEFNEVTKEGKVLVDMYASWCGPCKMLSPIIEELASTNKEYKFYKLDVDTCNEIPQKYGVMSIPTLLIFENGSLKETVVGLRSKAELESLLK